MNRFLVSTNRMLSRYGLDLTYRSITNSVYDVETGMSTPATTDFVARMYAKQIKANQYNYPNLIGKELILFYLANNALTFSPKPGDFILYKGSNYKVQEVQEHMAEGIVVLFRIICVKG